MMPSTATLRAAAHSSSGRSLARTVLSSFELAPKKVRTGESTSRRRSGSASACAASAAMFADKVHVLAEVDAGKIGTGRFKSRAKGLAGPVFGFAKDHGAAPGLAAIRPLPAAGDGRRGIDRDLAFAHAGSAAKQGQVAACDHAGPKPVRGLHFEICCRRE